MDMDHSWKRRLEELAWAGAAGAKRLGRAAGLAADTMARKDELRRAYEQLGRLWYSRNGRQPTQPYADLCARIARARSAIEENRAKSKEKDP